MRLGALNKSIGAGLLFLSAASAACGVAPAHPAGPVSQSAPLPSEPAVLLPPTCVDLGLSTKDACDAALAMLLPEQLPKARGNSVADALPAAQLGFQVFYDGRFSQTRDMPCATCHLPEKSFHDAKAVSLGAAGKALPRNSPSIFTSAWNDGEFFWDGRADSLWSQPLFAFENPEEMDSSRLAIAHIVTEQPFYRTLYAAAFGAIPDLRDLSRFPATGKPGDASFDGMAPQDQELVNRVFSNVGKALEAYMRKVATGRAPFDSYLVGQASLDDSAKRGLATFLKVGCADCHSGPTLSDGRYYNMGIPDLPGAAPDLGRELGLQILADNAFNAKSTFYDVREGEVLPAAVVSTGDVEGAFRTPTLRNIALTAPYGHNGFYPTLPALLADHGPTVLSEGEIESITIFLLQLNGKYPDRPWSNWPTN